jgi:hypothetical protein
LLSSIADSGQIPKLRAVSLYQYTATCGLWYLPESLLGLWM